MIRAAAALLLLAAAPGPHVLRADGIGPVRVGMTRAAAERALGARLRVTYSDADPVENCGDARRRDGRDPGISYMVEGGRISRIDIFTHTVRTERGIALGSTAASVRRAYGSAIVSKPHAYTDGRYYEVHMPGGHTGYVFEINGGKVTAMRSGNFPAVAFIEGCL